MHFKSLLLAGLALVAACAPKPEAPAIIPQPADITVNEGAFKVAGAAFQIEEGIPAEAVKAIGDFQAQVERVSGKKAGKGSAIRFLLNENIGPEGYALNVKPDGATVEASDFNGFFYAIQSIKQMLPVALNELFVRTFYFVRRLQKELNGKTTFDDVNWKAVLPFNNRTVDQMITVSSLTFSFADTADAAVRSAIESGGNFVLFSGKFACRFNYVGAGRAVVAVGKELSNEKKEAQLIHEKRLLIEAKTQVDIELIIAYRAELEKLVTAYIAEKLETVQTGFSVIDQAIAEDDIDKFLQGNRYIQEAFGKQEVQFSTQAEFDEFMDSEEALQL